MAKGWYGSGLSHAILQHALSCLEKARAGDGTYLDVRIEYGVMFGTQTLDIARFHLSGGEKLARRDRFSRHPK
jgi:hypothetical protein